MRKHRFKQEQTFYFYFFFIFLQVLAPPAPTHHPTVIVPAPTLTQQSHHHVTVVTKSPSVHSSTMSTSRQNLDTIVQVGHPVPDASSCVSPLLLFHTVMQQLCHGDAGVLAFSDKSPFEKLSHRVRWLTDGQ